MKTLITILVLFAFDLSAASTTLTSTLNLTSADNGKTFENYRISTTSGPCINASGAVGITIHNSEIGPCATSEACQGNGQGVWVHDGSNDMKILDSYIHPECGTSNAVYDGGSDVLCENSSGIVIQGSILAHGIGSNFFAYPNCPHATVRGNFLLNPQNGKGNRGSATQFLDGSNYGTVDRNYVLVTKDPKYGIPANSTDLINFGSISGNPPNNFGATVTGNYIQGGVWQYGCGINMEGGMSYDPSSPLSTIADNILVDPGTCGMSVESGFNYAILRNKVFARNTLPYPNANAFQALQCYGPGAACGGPNIPCGNLNYTNNMGYAIGNTGAVTGIYLAGDWPCSNITQSGNVFDNAPNQAAYNTMLPLLSTTMAPPAIPPVPYSCTVSSPWTNNTKVAACGSVTPPPVISCLGLKSFWTFIAPAGGSCLMDGTRAILTAPAGSNHDPQYGGMDNSVRIMQSIGPADFGVEVRFDSVPTKSYQFEGIAAVQDSANYLRLQFGFNGSTLVVNADTITGSTNSTTVFSKAVTGSSTSLWMRVTKTGPTVTLRYSRDGVTWLTAGTLQTPLTVTSIGPFVGNYNGDPAQAPLFSGRIDYFSRIAAPVSGLPLSDSFTK